MFPTIQNIRMGWVVCRAKQYLINKVLINYPPGERWMDRVKNYLKRTDQTVVIEDADDRDRRRVLVETAKRLQGVQSKRKKIDILFIL